ncbi:MAG TPA: ACP S-malonyltransferase [Verrucomicrobiae bacterium]|nr:ACP S-malonyltransferase [Verrucomicrobiae bacterium]
MNAFLFPGQGSQEVGMAADLFRTDPEFRTLVQRASHCVGADLEPICLRGPEKTLCRTVYLQPLLVAVSLGYLRHLTARGVKADVVLGHSLGELSTLAAAGVVTFEEAVIMAGKRGELMDKVASRVRGGMLAVTIQDGHHLPELPDNVVIANDNAPTQIVLSGELDALDALARRLGHCRKLAVAGPWHSPFMAEARREFAAWAETLTFRPPRTRLILNATGRSENNPQLIKQHVTDTLAGPVRWRMCMETLRALSPAALFEVGPGRVLAGLARVNGFGNDVRIIHVNNLRGVELAAAQSAVGGK